MRRTVLVTGAAGFIGSHLVRHLLRSREDIHVLGLDALTYSGSITTLGDLLDHERFTFVAGDIRDRDLIRDLLAEHRPDGIIHLAAESHVDRSIVDPLLFVETNVVGTVVLLQEAAVAWRDTGGRFHHVSTDEVFGELGVEGVFNEETPYAPNSPYSASKAAADHFVRVWSKSYGLEYVLTNCTNNYGPYQFPEKLIPMAVTRALKRESVPVYGKGDNVRDWLFVEDHCRALAQVFDRGRANTTYCIGGEAEISNLDLVHLVLDSLDRHMGNDAGGSRALIEFVGDRPGHDFRYAMDISLIGSELGWAPSVTLRQGIDLTVSWYIENQEWVRSVESDDHHGFQRSWYEARSRRVQS